MKTTIIGFSGRIGSGKSTLSVAVGEALGWSRVSFGHYVRREARQRGLDESREILQEIGASLVEDLDKFCRSVLAQASWGRGQHLIVDGVRHAQVLHSLREITKPSEVLLIYVDVDDSTRLRRLRGMSAAESERLPQIEEHSTESEVKAVLRDMAGLVVDGARPEGDLVQEIIMWFRKDSEVGEN